MAAASGIDDSGLYTNDLSDAAHVANMQQQLRHFWQQQMQEVTRLIKPWLCP